MLTFNPLYTASRGMNSQRRSRDSFPVSHSSPELLNESGEYGEPTGLQVQLDPQEKAFLPMFSSQEGGSIPMKGDYLSHEAIPEWGLRGKHYLSSKDRKEYELFFKDDVYRDSKENLLHGEYLYIVLPNDRLYGCKPGTQRFHSYLSSGLNVKAAGILYCHYGSIVTISNESGHYKPTHEEMLPALKRFANNGTYPFVFEDHSEIKTKDDGVEKIKHFNVILEGQNLDLERLDSQKLKAKIDFSIDYAQTLFKTTAFNALAKSEPTPASSSSDYELDAYSDSGDERDPNSVFMSTDIPPEEQYLKLTCLWRMAQPKNPSRILGHITSK